MRLLVDERRARQLSDDRLRLLFTCCHPALGQEAQVGARTADDLRADDRRDRPGVRRARADDRPAHQPGEGEDRAGPDPVPGAAGARAAGTTSGRAERRVPRLHDGAPRGRRRARARGSTSRPRRSGSAECWWRSCRTRPSASGLLALMLATEARRPARVDEAGDIVLLADQDRTRWDHDAIAEAGGAGRGGPAAGEERPVPDPGGDRLLARTRADVGRHRLAADRRAVRDARIALADAGRTRQPGRRGRRSRRPAGRPRVARRPRRLTDRAVAPLLVDTRPTCSAAPAISPPPPTPTSRHSSARVTTPTVGSSSVGCSSYRLTVTAVLRSFRSGDRNDHKPGRGLEDSADASSCSGVSAARRDCDD